MSPTKHIQSIILFLGLALSPMFVFASAKTEVDKANACKENGESAGTSRGETALDAFNNNYNATASAESSFRERGGQITAEKVRMEKKEKSLKDKYGSLESDPEGKRAMDELRQCIEDAGGAADSANKQAEDAKKSNEEKGGGGGMPDLSSLLSALQKEKKEEEKKDGPLDCSSPENGSNPVCMCQINPRSNGCGNQESTQTTAATKKDRASKDSLSPGNFPLGGTPTAAERQATKTNAPGLPGAGGSGSGGMGSSAAGGKTGNDSTLGAPYARPPGVIEGSYGGGGGGSRSASGGYRSDTPLGRSSAMIQRRMASIGRANLNKDGMTGPHTDLFMKVRTRYLSVRSSLKP